MSSVLGIGKALSDFATRYDRFFRTRTRTSFGIALFYLMGLFKASERTYDAMASAVDGVNAQQLQHFIANSPWDHRTLLNQVAKDADRVLGGQPDSCLIIDESAFPKKGEQTVGVARQWCGRLGKVDNCQVGVFAVLSDGRRHTIIDERLYLPKEWTDNEFRCSVAGVPRESQNFVTKSQHALDMIRCARSVGIRFSWVGFDGGYGKDPAFLRAIDDMGVVFVGDVHCDQKVWLVEPVINVPQPRSIRGRKPTKKRAETSAETVEKVASSLRATNWIRMRLRDATRGPLIVDVAVLRVWVWHGQEERPRSWHLVIRKEVRSPTTIKYSLSNAPMGTPSLRLAQMQGQRYWVERALEDGKESCGLADNQGRSWPVWHHHISMVILALLFVLEQRITQNDDIDLLSPNDIVIILKAMLPVTISEPERAIRRINDQHRKRRSAIRSRSRDLAKLFDPVI